MTERGWGLDGDWDGDMDESCGWSLEDGMDGIAARELEGIVKGIWTERD